MKNAAAKIVSLVLLLSLALSLSACGDLFSTIDYSSVEKLEQSVNLNGDPTGKTVKVTVEKVFSDGGSGYIVQQGKFNFCLATDPVLGPGETVTFKISSVSKQSNVFYVNCTKV